MVSLESADVLAAYYAEPAGYSLHAFTSVSRDVNGHFNLDIGRRPSANSLHDLNMACFLASHSREFDSVLGYFASLVEEVGYLPALPFNEIPRASRSRVRAEDLEYAVREGYLVPSILPGSDIVLVELSPKVYLGEEKQLGLVSERRDASSN